MSDYGQYRAQSQQYGAHLKAFVEPLLVELDEHLDKRLVGTFLRALEAIVTFRHSVYGLLLSELGAFILTPDHAPAGTKRLSNLLRSTKWTGKLIEDFLWREATRQVETAESREETVYIGWDESVVEKPESIELEGLCAVRSTSAARLKRIKPGFYNPPGGRPIFVPGMQWISLLVLVSNLPPVVDNPRDTGQFSPRGRRCAAQAVLAGLATAGCSCLGIEASPVIAGCAKPWASSCVSSSAGRNASAYSRPKAIS